MVLSNLRLSTNNGEVGLILSIYLCELEEPDKISAREEGTEISWFNQMEAAIKLAFKYPEEITMKITSLG